MSIGAGSIWINEETLKLIEMWGQKSIQKQSDECKWNKTVYEAVAKEMREAGYDRTYKQCGYKIKKPEGDYKDELKRDEPPGIFFDPMDEVLGHRPATRPTVIAVPRV